MIVSKKTKHPLTYLELGLLIAVIRCETTEAYRIFESIDRKGAGCFGNGRAQGSQKSCLARIPRTRLAGAGP